MSQPTAEERAKLLKRDLALVGIHLWVSNERWIADAIRSAEAEARREGAEKMREAAAVYVAHELSEELAEVAEGVRSLPLPGE